MRTLFWKAPSWALAAVALMLGLNATPLAAQSMEPAATVALGTSDKLGTFLVDGKGMTLYMFAKDTANTSNCYGKCEGGVASLTVSDKVVLGKGLLASLQSTTKRKDGTIQVTYAGWPLYYFVKDKAPGDVAGQGVGNVWFVVAADGSLIKTAM